MDSLVGHYRDRGRRRRPYRAQSPSVTPQGSIALPPDSIHTYPWSSPPGVPTSHAPSFLVNLCPTVANPAGFNVTLPGNIVLRYHLVLNVPTSVGNLEPSNTCCLVPPPAYIRSARFLPTLPLPKWGDSFGHGILRIPEWLPTMMAVSLDVYRAHPYREVNDPRRSTVEKFKVST
ncbi:hypothetical protein FA13DRAFT_87192 [Coprinellus micaceus]|uniref:Uncharacterized protein n=1 Tax=Coprinellus micaceus TaxID=71717 RepID=A0A4Y7SJT2_COPMI|nr:hypothetical protein FA13DRAFT_87192 [Coprinellus micaceus]